MRITLTFLAAVLVLTGFAPRSHANRKPVQIAGQTAGPTPFISLVSLQIDNPNSFAYAEFSIAPKEGSVTRPITARYSRANLLRRGYIHADTREIVVPVFGLYAKYDNAVTLTTGFVDGTTQTDTVTISTPKFKNSIHKRPTVVLPRQAESTLSYDYLLIKNFALDNSPVIVDTDGEVRWVGTADGVETLATALYQNGIYVAAGAALLRIEFDGVISTLQDYTALAITGFHHNLDFGRDGLIAGVDTTADIESVLIEFDAAGYVLRSWNPGDIISAAMTAGGDDASQFVVRSKDWFHNNAVAYRASDNSLVISSRENFIIALDYDTGAIKWIFGDTTKNWGRFPSLRKYALKPTAGTHFPIGQHSLSFVRDRLLLFDNGFQSLVQQPPGKGRLYSGPRKYRIDTENLTATETWNYNLDRTLRSAVCSSVYEDQPGNYLIDYSAGGAVFPPQPPGTPLTTQIMGLDAEGRQAFIYQYFDPQVCAAGWNAVPVHLEKMVFE